MKTLKISKLKLMGFEVYARVNPYREKCALGLGDSKNRIDNIVPVSNSANEGYIDYLMNPQEMFDIIKDTKLLNKKSKKHFTAIIHSHPRGCSSNPSSIDLTNAEYNVFYLIYSVENDDWSCSILRKNTLNGTTEKYFEKAKMVILK